MSERKDPYIELVEASRDDLAFLLDNLGQRIALDGSMESLRAVEGVLQQVHRGEMDTAVWPELLETLAQLLARYAALVLIGATSCNWSLARDAQAAFLDVVPGEAWNRYPPLRWQAVLRDVQGDTTAISAEVSRLIDENKRYTSLLTAVLQIVSEASALSEPELIKELATRGQAPDERFFGTAARAFPKRVANILRRSKRFRCDRSTGRWSAVALNSCRRTHAPEPDR